MLLMSFIELYLTDKPDLMEFRFFLLIHQYGV